MINKKRLLFGLGIVFIFCISYASAADWFEYIPKIIRIITSLTGGFIFGLLMGTLLRELDSY